MINKLKRLIIEIKKTPVELTVGKYKLIAPPEHKIGDYLQWLKYYSRNLPRIAKYIEEKYSEYNIIDVGANIGDSIALLRSHAVFQHIYAIEGEPSYFRMLEKNAEQFSQVQSFQCFLGESTQKEQFFMDAVEGTGKLSYNKENFVEVKKLDDLIVEYSFSNIKLLKIDTDGFDLKILRGSFEALAEFKPVLFFEYDSKYLKEQGDDGLQIFNDLAALGYKRILYYDNYGKLLISITTTDYMMIRQLYTYISNEEGAFHYYDLCVFHENDDDLAESIIEKELEFFNKATN